MGYVKQNLLPNEELVYETRLHGVVFFWPVVLLLLAIAALVGAQMLPPSTSQLSVTTALIGAAAILGVVGLVLLIPQFVAWNTTELGVTDQRVMAKSGFIRRRSLEMVLQGVESIGVDQAILGRILNYGTVTIIGSGGTKESFTRIASPFTFRRSVNEQIGVAHERT